MKTRSILLAFGVCLFCVTANAGIILTLDSLVQSGPPTGSVTFTGSLFNSGPDTIYLNSLTGSLSSPDLVLDDTAFLTLVPASLDFLGSYTGPIFDIIIGGSALSADYTGSVTIQGGVDTNAYDDLVTQNIQVTVSSVPEPSAFSLLGIGMVGVLVIGRLRSRVCHGSTRG